MIDLRDLFTDLISSIANLLGDSSEIDKLYEALDAMEDTWFAPICMLLQENAAFVGGVLARPMNIDKVIEGLSAIFDDAGTVPESICVLLIDLLEELRGCDTTKVRKKLKGLLRVMI